MMDEWMDSRRLIKENKIGAGFSQCTSIFGYIAGLGLGLGLGGDGGMMRESGERNSNHNFTLGFFFRGFEDIYILFSF